MDAMASSIGNLVIDNVQANSIGKTDYTKQAIENMNAQMLPGGLGGVGSGFIPVETPYSASSTLFGPSMGLQGRQRPIMLADAGGNPENTLLAWQQAAKQVASDGVNFVKGLANTPIQFVNGGLELGHAAVKGLETVGVFPPGAGDGKTLQIPYFRTDGGFAARSGNAAGFALTMFDQIPAQAGVATMKGARVFDAVLSGQIAKTSATLGELEAVDRLLYGARVGEGLPGSTGIPIANRPTPAQLEALTVKHDVEFAVTYQLGPGKGGGGGQYFLFSGETSAVRVPLRSDSMLVYHTHPRGTAWASPADMDVMHYLEAVGSPQRSSQIVPVGNDVVRFNSNSPRF